IRDRHRHTRDDQSHYVRKDMFYDNDNILDSHNLCRCDEIRFPQLQHLSPDGTAASDPAHADHRNDQAVNTVSKHYHQKKRNDHARDTVKHIHDTLDEQVYFSPVISGDTSYQRSDDTVNDTCRKTDRQRYPGAHPGSYPEVAAQAVSPEPVAR